MCWDSLYEYRGWKIKNHEHSKHEIIWYTFRIHSKCKNSLSACYSNEVVFNGLFIHSTLTH